MDRRPLQCTASPHSASDWRQRRAAFAVKRKALDLEHNVPCDSGSSKSSSEDDSQPDGPPALAVCISGAVRSFPRETFRASFRQFCKEMPPLDVFVVLKMTCEMGTLLNSEEGVESFMRTMYTLRPKAVVLFDRHADPHVDACSAASQLLMIDESFRLAELHGGKYAYFMRYRPDFVMMETRVHWPHVRDDTIYTSRKLDAPASDQAFLLSHDLKESWWGRRFRLDDIYCVCPEYTIFNTKHRVQNGPWFHGGLLRPTETQHVLLWEEEPQQRADCAFLQDEMSSHKQLPLSHRPLRAKFRQMIHARMLRLGVPYTYVETLTAAYMKEQELRTKTN